MDHPESPSGYAKELAPSKSMHNLYLKPASNALVLIIAVHFGYPTLYRSADGVLTVTLSADEVVTVAFSELSE
jgi:hypothetical protein